jgi:Zn-dependent protease with chaperone function
VSSARRAYRLHVGLGGLAAASVLLGGAVAVTRLELGLPSGDALVAACRRLFPFDPGVGMLLLLGLVSLGVAVSALAVRSLLRQVGAQRRFLRAIRPVTTLHIGGHPVTLIEGERAQAFCAGVLRTRIYISTATRGLLSEVELRAVVAHEAHHRANRDPVKILLARVLADALFFVPGLRRLGRRYTELTEVAADEAATRAVDGPAFASALLAFGERRGAAGAVVGIAPERIDHLLGRGPAWQLPLSILIGFALTIVALWGLILTVPALIERESVNLAMLLAEACMMAMSMAPLAVAAYVVVLSRKRLASSRIRT